MNFFPQMGDYSVIGYSTSFLALITIGAMGIVLFLIAMILYILETRKRGKLKDKAPTKREFLFFFTSILGALLVIGSLIIMVGTYSAKPLNHAQVFQITGKVTETIVIESAERPYILTQLDTMDEPVTTRDARILMHPEDKEITFNCRNVMLPRSVDDIRCAIAN